MASEDRRRFSTLSDWHDFLGEIRQKDKSEEVNLYDLRRACYGEIEGLRERPLFVYATQFPNASSGAPTGIDFNDVDGFTDLIEAADEDAEAVDVLIHSGGGAPEATERIVQLLRSRFDKVTFLVPHSAYSAATMLALSGNSIILHPSACLGPIDPQLNGIPARSIRRGFEKVRELIKEEGPEALPAYIPLLEKHSLEELEICEDSEQLAQELATEWLSDYMLADEEDTEDRQEKIERAVSFFSSYDKHKTHARPLSYDKVSGLGLNIEQAEGELRSLLREAHIVLSGFFGVTPFVKLYENGNGLSYGRQYQVGAGGGGGREEGDEE